MTMVVWGYGPFDNDVARDFFAGLGILRKKRRFLNSKTTTRRKDLVFRELRKALNDDLPENPSYVFTRHWRRRKSISVLATSRDKKPPMVFTKRRPEPFLRRAAAWVVYCFDLVGMRRLAISRLEELLEYSAWISQFKQPARLKAAIRKQIEELESISRSKTAASMVIVNPVLRVRRRAKK